MISDPPTNSPSMKICGNVGQLLTAQKERGEHYNIITYRRELVVKLGRTSTSACHAKELFEISKKKSDNIYVVL